MVTASRNLSLTRACCASRFVSASGYNCHVCNVVTNVMRAVFFPFIFCKAAISTCIPGGSRTPAARTHSPSSSISLTSLLLFRNSCKTLINRTKQEQRICNLCSTFHVSLAQAPSLVSCIDSEFLHSKRNPQKLNEKKTETFAALLNTVISATTQHIQNESWPPITHHRLGNIPFNVRRNDYYHCPSIECDALSHFLAQLFTLYWSGENIKVTKRKTVTYSIPYTHNIRLWLERQRH